MRQDLKKQWVEALRSGKYEQGRGVLRNNEGQYCCLGVLAEEMDYLEKDLELQTYICKLPEEDYTDDSVSYLSSGVLSKTGIWEVEQVKLAEMNDEGLSFSSIADWIEGNL